MLLHTGPASDTQWDLMKLSPAWRPTGPVLVVTCIMFWCNVFMSWGHGAGDKQQTQPACLARTLQTDIRQCVTEHSLESVAAHPACCQPGPARPGRVQWGGEHGHHTPGGHDGDHRGPLCVWWHPPGHVCCMFEAQGWCECGAWCGDMAGWPGLPVCAGCLVWPHSGLSPQWRAELRECTQWPGARLPQLSAATTDNSSRECDNNTTTQRQGEARHWVARRLIVDKTVLWSLNSSSNIPQLISRHIAHPTFLILRSLAATVARAGIFKRLRLGLNTHYTLHTPSRDAFLHKATFK